MTKPASWVDTYSGNVRWLRDRVVLKTLAGSRLYGTWSPSSDWDFKGVVVRPTEDLLGLPAQNFEQAEWKFQYPHNFPEESHDAEACVYSLQKFAALALDANPNILELLWSPKLCVHPSARPLVDARDAFLSTRVRHTFSGYARSQLKRMESHRRWLLNPPQTKPTREDFGLPEFTMLPREQLGAVEAAVQKKMDGWALDLSGVDAAQRAHITQVLEEQALHGDAEYVAATRAIGISDDLVEVMRRERAYRSAQKQWDAYQTWKENRNPERAALEAECGYDAKHGMHLIRLLRMGREVLAGHGVVVCRELVDSQELREIRRGEWSYDRLMTEVSRVEAEIEQVVQTTRLPRTPDRARVHKLVAQLQLRFETCRAFSQGG